MKIMKRISIILMIFEMLLGVIAFGQENNNKKISKIQFLLKLLEMDCLVQ